MNLAKAIDRERTNKRKRFYASQDEIEERLKQHTTVVRFFTAHSALNR